MVSIFSAFLGLSKSRLKNSEINRPYGAFQMHAYSHQEHYCRITVQEWLSCKVSKKRSVFVRLTCFQLLFTYLFKNTPLSCHDNIIIFFPSQQLKQNDKAVTSTDYVIGTTERLKFKLRNIIKTNMVCEGYHLLSASLFISTIISRQKDCIF